MIEPLIPMREAAIRAGCQLADVQTAYDNGSLWALRVGKQRANGLRFRPGDVDAWVAAGMSPSRPVVSVAVAENLPTATNDVERHCGTHALVETLRGSAALPQTRDLDETICDAVTLGGWLYFVSPAIVGGPVKIGIAWDLHSRLTGLQTGCPWPLDLLGIMLPKSWDAAECERMVHSHFAGTRMQGEWFERSPELLEFIALCRVVCLPVREFAAMVVAKRREMNGGRLKPLRRSRNGFRIDSPPMLPA